MSDRLSPSAVASPPRLFMESLVVFVGLAIVVAFQIAITRNAAIISHPMWLDESVSALLLTDPSFWHVVASIHGGVDTNGPAFYVTTWPIVHLLDATSVSALRLITAAIMLIGLAGVYATARRFVDPGRAAIGALAIAVHPAVLVQTWQVRMYGFWLAAAAWFCAYTVFAAPQARWRTRLAGCLLAIVLVTAHWLGILVLGLVSVTALALTWRNADRRMNHALPFGVGLITLGLCLPLIISQRRLVTVPTWIEPATGSAVLTQLRLIFVVPSIVIVAMYIVLRGAMRTERRVRVAGQATMLLPTLALLLYPAMLVAMSFTMQSVLIERYMLPTVIGLAVIAAVAALSLRAWLGAAAGALAIGTLVVIGCLELHGLRAVNRSADERSARVESITRRVLSTDNATTKHLVFARRFEAYPLLQARPELADSVALLDFPSSDGLMRRTLFERDLGRAVSRFYPRYRLVTEDTLRAWGRFEIVTNSNEEDELRRLLPGFRLTRLGPDEYLADAQ